MTWSLNEIEALAKKASRGAGYSWGLAEEAGKAARWLCAMGLPGAECLNAHLLASDGLPHAGRRPADICGIWAASSGTLCPLIAGATLCDLATELAAGRIVKLERTAFPLLIYPYLAAASDMTGSALSLGWDGATLTRRNGTSQVDADAAILTAAIVAGARIGPAASAGGRIVRRAYRGEIPAAVVDSLTRLAHRTYAPDTEKSRLAGAGAGLTDND